MQDTDRLSQHLSHLRTAIVWGCEWYMLSKIQNVQTKSFRFQLTSMRGRGNANDGMHCPHEKVRPNILSFWTHKPDHSRVMALFLESILVFYPVLNAVLHVLHIWATYLWISDWFLFSSSGLWILFSKVHLFMFCNRGFTGEYIDSTALLGVLPLYKLWANYIWTKKKKIYNCRCCRRAIHLCVNGISLLRELL